MSAPNLRARKAPQAPSSDSPAPVVINPPPRRGTSSSPPTSWSAPKLTFDILRILIGLLLLSSTLSYFITADSSILWGYPRPTWTKLDRIKAYFEGPLHLTDTQLRLYNGSSPALPILLALNGSIYDVSASPHLYGPGGSYSFFAGRDATRGFVTGCFDSDLNGDLRGVEEMFVPVHTEDGDVGGVRLSGREKKIRREKETREAKKKVKEVVEGWRKLFDGGKGGKYFYRGKVDRGVRSGWEGWGDVKELCEKARMGRPGRTAEEV